MALSFTSAQIKSILMKPILIKDAIQEVIKLQDPSNQVISTSACMAIVVELFNDFRSGSAPLFTELAQLDADLREWSSYLYRTTDELNAEIGLAGTDVARVNVLRAELTSVFNLMNAGYAAGGKIAQNISDLENDFFDSTPHYQANYITTYPAASFDMVWNEARVDQIIVDINSAVTTLNQQQSELNRLRTMYSTTIEPITPIQTATWFPSEVWVRAENNAVTPRLSIYTDANHITGLGSRFPVDSLLVKTADTYTIHYDDSLILPNTALKVIDAGGNTLSVAHGGTLTTLGSDFKTFRIYSVSGTTDLNAENAAGIGSFIVI